MSQTQTISPNFHRRSTFNSLRQLGQPGGDHFSPQPAELDYRAKLSEVHVASTLAN